MDYKNFQKIFQKIAYRHSSSKAFSDFLEYTILIFSHQKSEKKQEFEQTYGSGFADLFQELLNLYKDCDTWIDPLGNIYENMGTSYGRSHFGQFFTPEPIAEFMASCLYMEMDEKAQRVLDPACGSGRMLLAFNKIAKNYKISYFAIDLDRNCVLMTAINMLFHGIRGEVVWKDALNFSEWREGFVINRTLQQTYLPSIEKIEKEQSFIWHADQQKIQDFKEKEIQKEIEKQKEIERQKELEKEKELEKRKNQPQKLLFL